MEKETKQMFFGFAGMMGLAVGIPIVIGSLCNIAQPGTWVSLVLGILLVVISILSINEFFKMTK